MLASAADAEDVLQETWLRCAGVDLATVRDQRAYLVRITTGQALNRLRTLGRRKGSYAARRPRGAVSAAETRDALEAFQRAIETGDLQRLIDILAPDVVFLGDGGGVVQAALAPIVGVDSVAPLAAGLSRFGAAASLRPAQINGHPALILRLNGEIDTVIAVRIDDGLISGLYAVRNPEKLSRVEREPTMRRWNAHRPASSARGRAPPCAPVNPARPPV